MCVRVGVGGGRGTRARPQRSAAHAGGEHLAAHAAMLFAAAAIESREGADKIDSGNGLTALPEGSEQLQQCRGSFNLGCWAAEVQIQAPQPQCAACEGLNVTQIDLFRPSQGQGGLWTAQSQDEWL